MTLADATISLFLVERIMVFCAVYAAVPASARDRPAVRGMSIRYQFRESEDGQHRLNKAFDGLFKATIERMESASQNCGKVEMDNYA